MEQNYQYDQGNSYGNQQYGYQYPVQTPVYQQPNQSAEQIVATYADEAFSKGLASTIMSQFPIASFIAIGFGNKSLQLVDKAREVAAYYGVSAGGKTTAAKVLGKIGKIVGIVNSILWSVYGVIYAVYILLMIFAAFA